MALAKLGIRPVRGTLDDAEVLRKAAHDADVTVNAADAGHRAAAASLPQGACRHRQNSSCTPTAPASWAPARAVSWLRKYSMRIRCSHRRRSERREWKSTRWSGSAAGDGVRSIVIAPSLIYGLGHGLNSHSIQVPWLIKMAKKFGVAKHIGSGENRWANVHIDDLIGLYVLAIEKAPAGAFYFAENGENSMREVCEAISRMLGQGGRTRKHDRARRRQLNGATDRPTIPWAPIAASAPSARARNSNGGRRLAR